MKFGLPDAFIEVVKSFGIAHPEINQILLFGSRATGVFKNGSDVDPVLIGNELTKDHVIQFEHKLKPLDTPNKFDVLLMNGISSVELKKQIAAGHCTLQPVCVCS